MPQAQHGKTEILMFSNGAYYAIEQEYIGLVGLKTYVDARNMRLTPMDNNDQAINRIKGEELRYPAIYNQCIGGGGNIPDTYKCMCANTVNQYIFEVWCDRLKALPTFFRINGKIVAMSSKILFNVDYPIEWDVNDTVLGGEIFLTDFQSGNPPQIYNIREMLNNSGIDFVTGLDDPAYTCTQVYFDDYNPALYSVNQILTADRPAFIEVAAANPDASVYTTIGTGGLVYGSYQYRFRFKNQYGDPSLMSKPTPLIPVPSAVGTDDTNYPYEKTYGGQATLVSGMGIAFKFRVNNYNNYSQCEIIRVSFNAGSALGTVGAMESIHVFNINLGTQQGSDGNVVAFFDIGATGTAIDSETATNTMSVVDRARAVRYFEKRQYLMNIVYQGRDLDNAVTFKSSPDVMFPIVKKLYKSGHKDPYHVAYNKPYLHGEKYGFAVVFYDSFGARSFAAPINDTSVLYPALGDFNNFQMPNRRDIPDASADIYGLGLVQAEQSVQDVSGNESHGDTFEVFDLADATQKTDECVFKNIANLDINGFNYPAVSNVTDGGCEALPENSFNSDGAGDWGITNRAAANYQPFHPIAETDTSVTGNNFHINVQVNTDGTGGTDIAYNPKGFSPDYYALGMALAGIDTMPDWVAGFSVVRTKPGGRVVCQGIGMYSMNQATPHHGHPLTTGTTKQQDSFWFYSPDMESGLINFADLNANPSRFKIQFVSPLGFFSELHNFKTNALGAIKRYNKDDYNVDMISYARILYEDGTINPGDGTLGDNGYIQFGKWRSPSFGGDFAAYNAGSPQSTGGNTLFDFLSINAKDNSIGGTSPTQTYYEIFLNAQNIYGQFGAAGDTLFDDANVKLWHEPYYIVNIIDTLGEVDISTNQREYVETEHYQKIVSVIGVSDSSINQSFDLVDERWEDCITQIGNTAENKYIYIKSIAGIEVPYIDITNKNAGQITNIIADITNGTNTSGSNPNGNLAGTYTHTITTAANGSATPEDRFYTIVFGSTYVPAKGEQIIVRYDKTYPCVVFGGDSVVGEAVFAPLDGQNAVGGYQDVDVTDHAPGATLQFRLRTGMPYRSYQSNKRYYIYNETPAATGVQYIQDQDFGNTEFIRQMLVMFSVESRMCVPLAFNDTTVSPANRLKFFPSVGYVMRPHRWDNTLPYNGTGVNGNCVFTDYGTDFPEEITDLGGTNIPDGWIYGGFRFNQLRSTISPNIDYSHDQDNFKDFTKPTVGFEEIDWFPTRVIWSEKREINIQNSPGLKTFPALNFRDIADDTGAIMRAFDAYATDKGSSLYAFTEKGICLLMVNKFMMRQATSNTMGLMKGEGDTSIMEEVWLNKEQGLPQGFFRSFAEMGNDCWFANSQSVWKLTQNQLVDIGRKNYHSRVWRDMIKNVRPGFQDEMTAIYDNYHDEYWLSFKKGMTIFNERETSLLLDSDAYYDGQIFEIVAAADVTLPTTSVFTEIYIYNNTGGNLDIINQADSSLIITLVDGEIAHFYLDPNDTTLWLAENNHFFSRLDLSPITFVYKDDGTDKGKWLGYYDYDFDMFCVTDNYTFGMRSAETYNLDIGDVINNAPIEGGVLIASTGGGAEQLKAKEFIRIRVAANQKPSRVEFYDSLENYRNGVISSYLDVSQGTLYLKDYDGYENFIPRKFVSPYDRQQGRIMLAYLRFYGDGTFFMPSTEITFKNLK